MCNSPTLKTLSLFPVCLGLLASPLQAFDWHGTVDSDFAKADNWRLPDASNEPPSAGVENKEVLNIINGDGAPLYYTEKEGETTFVEQLRIGIKGCPGAALQVSGGHLTVKQAGMAIIGQVGPGTLEITGGTLELLGGFKDSGMEDQETTWSLYLGNEPTGNGTITISGGKMILEWGIEVGRRSGTGLITISGNGSVTAGGPTSFGEGEPSKKIVIGQGSGVFEQVANGNITFAPDSPDAWISFTKGSHGKLSLKGKDKKYFDGLVAAGRIRIDDSVAAPTAFVFSKNGDQGEYHLAP
ncbi:MAG: hypothetical protein ABIT76_14330 [Chthoniobacterales bacterium]